MFHICYRKFGDFSQNTQLLFCCSSISSLWAWPYTYIAYLDAGGCRFLSTVINNVYSLLSNVINSGCDSCHSLNNRSLPILSVCLWQLRKPKQRNNHGANVLWNSSQLHGKPHLNPLVSSVSYSDFLVHAGLRFPGAIQTRLDVVVLIIESTDWMSNRAAARNRTVDATTKRKGR